MANDPTHRLRPLVLDASAAINLLATEKPWQILAALGFRARVVEQVLGEVVRCPVTKRKYEGAKHPFRISPNVEVVALKGPEVDAFVEIAQSVGDGEAASIALAASQRLPLAIDDRRARRVALERDAGLQLYWTTQLLRAKAIKQAFPNGEAETFIEAAVKFARMYLPPEE